MKFIFIKVFVAFVVFFSLMLSSDRANGHAFTNYVVHIQDDRYQNRWTLTEWLRIKERMRMMDLWLALFSDPKKDKIFKPELSLTYGLLNGLTLQDQGGILSTYNQKSAMQKGQIWLTNLVSSSVGIRTLNIEIGFEVMKRVTERIDEVSLPGTNTEPLMGTPSQKHWAGLLRVFGKNIQDSSLIFKYGQYTYPGHLGWSEVNSQSLHGLMAGGELSLYLFKWLGMEGNYYQFGDESSLQSTQISGRYFDYMAYMEVSILRVMLGVYAEEWETDDGLQDTKLNGGGTFSGIKLQI